jgi:hypothetical protein
VEDTVVEVDQFKPTDGNNREGRENYRQREDWELNNGL